MIDVKEFNRFIPDWVFILLLLSYSLFIGVDKQPFLRKFSITNDSIKFPNSKEQISDLSCLLIITIIPISIITLKTLHLNRFKFTKVTINQLHASILGLSYTISIVLFITIILKNSIGRARPDFIARCKPNLTSIKPSIESLYDISICTNPNVDIIYEGLKSFPSGHSSLSFGTLTYLTIWLYHRFETEKIYQVLLVSIPEFLALWIGVTRIQDFKHHPSDVFIGSSIGIIISGIIYKRLFKNEKIVYLNNDQPTLPLYNNV